MKVSLKGWISPLVLLAMLALGVIIEAKTEKPTQKQVIYGDLDFFAFHLPVLEKEFHGFERLDFFEQSSQN